MMIDEIINALIAPPNVNNFLNKTTTAINVRIKIETK